LFLEQAYLAGLEVAVLVSASIAWHRLLHTVLINGFSLQLLRKITKVRALCYQENMKTVENGKLL
jgi:hypothetical protein